MLELIGSGLLALWLEMTGVQALKPAHVSNLVETTLAVLPSMPDPAAEAIVQQYLQRLSATGLSAESQGVWIQVGNHVVAAHQGYTPLSAASLTKVATSLAALGEWGPDHQFETLIGVTGPIQGGIVNGDLIIQGSGDPYFVWEEAIAIGNALQQAGIRQVTGNILVTGKFSMNFQSNPVRSGQLFQQGINAQQWSSEVAAQHRRMGANVSRPNISVSGTVQLVTPQEAERRLSQVIVRHQSLPLTEMLKAMNIYSSNFIADQLGELLGGGPEVARRAARLSRVPVEEIQLINGSGLGQENRISPRAVAAMFTAMQRQLRPHHLNVADFFPVAGRDGGTVANRQLPQATAIKTGTLSNVSALSGAIPTRDRGLVWFTIINRGNDLNGLRRQQDVLVQALTKQWGAGNPQLVELAPNTVRSVELTRLGASSRNQIMTELTAR